MTSLTEFFYIVCSLDSFSYFRPIPNKDDDELISESTEFHQWIVSIRSAIKRDYGKSPIAGSSRQKHRSGSNLQRKRSHSTTSESVEMGQSGGHIDQPMSSSVPSEPTDLWNEQSDSEDETQSDIGMYSIFYTILYLFNIWLMPRESGKRISSMIWLRIRYFNLLFSVLSLYLTTLFIIIISEMPNPIEDVSGPVFDLSTEARNWLRHLLPHSMVTRFQRFLRPLTYGNEK